MDIWIKCCLVNIKHSAVGALYMDLIQHTMYFSSIVYNTLCIFSFVQ